MLHRFIIITLLTSLVGACQCTPTPSIDDPTYEYDSFDDSVDDYVHEYDSIYEGYQTVAQYLKKSDILSPELKKVCSEIHLPSDKYPELYCFLAEAWLDVLHKAAIRPDNTDVDAAVQHIRNNEMKLQDVILIYLCNQKTLETRFQCSLCRLEQFINIVGSAAHWSLTKKTTEFNALKQSIEKFLQNSTNTGTIICSKLSALHTCKIKREYYDGSILLLEHLYERFLSPDLKKIVSKDDIATFPDSDAKKIGTCFVKWLYVATQRPSQQECIAATKNIAGESSTLNDFLVIHNFAQLADEAKLIGKELRSVIEEIGKKNHWSSNKIDEEMEFTAKQAVEFVIQYKKEKHESNHLS